MSGITLWGFFWGVVSGGVWSHRMAFRILVPNPGSNLHPQQWKLGVLTADLREVLLTVVSDHISVIMIIVWHLSERFPHSGSKA